MWIINKYHVKLTESFHLSKLFKLFQILDAVRVDYMSNMQKLQWSQECCAKKNPFWSQCTSIESTIKKPICSPYNSTWLLSWCAFFPCHPWPWCSSSGPAGSLQSLPKASQLCPSNPRGFRCHGRLGEECFPQKSDLWIWALCLFWQSNPLNLRCINHSQDQTCSTLLLRFWSDPVCILWEFSEIRGQIRQWWCGQSYPLGLFPRHLPTKKWRLLMAPK